MQHQLGGVLAQGFRLVKQPGNQRYLSEQDRDGRVRENPGGRDHRGLGWRGPEIGQGCECLVVPVAGYELIELGTGRGTRLG